MFPLFYIFSDWGLFALRLALGLVMAAHGFPKLRSLKTTSANFSGMGFRPGIVWGPFAAILEFFGGLAIVFGLFVQIFAALLAVQFIVITIWKIFKRSTFSALEIDFLILAGFVALFTVGAGLFSLDRIFFR